MTIMFLIAGGILGLGLFLMIRRKFNKAEKRGELASVALLCPGCGQHFKADEAWQRTGLRGDFFSCPGCGQTSIWNLKVKPPRLRK